jgi:type III restriction enzyme
MASEDDDFGLVGQDKIIAVVRRKVDRWRGFALGAARDPFPDAPPRYQAEEDGEREVSDTTMGLLQHWFRREPHMIGRDQTDAFKYWPHQRRTVETFIYLHEVRGIRRSEQLWQLAGLAPLANQRDPWAKLGGQLATGSGKTKMMSLLVAWWHLNAVRERGGSFGAGRHAILIAPGLFVRDRLFQDFFPPAGGASVFTADPVVPPSMEQDWSLKVYSPTTCPLRLDPDDGALVVTNYHQLLRTRSADDDPGIIDAERRKLSLLFDDDEPARLEALDTPLVDRFGKSRGLLVLNDEAHHVWDETGHARFEDRAKEKSRLGKGEDASADMAWIRSIRRLHGAGDAAGRVGLQIDLSATLFEEAGADKSTKGGKTTTEFKPADLFRHTAVTYGLADAIRDGIVKRPVLERLKVRNKQTGEREPSVRPGQPNAWEKYRNLMLTGIERWKKVKAQLEDEGDKRKPIMFILCNDKAEAREVANYLTYGEATKDDLSGRPLTGFRDGQSKSPLFLETGADGVVRSTVVEIHIGEKEEKNEADWERVRQAVNAIDRDELPDPTERKDAHGAPVMIPNPYNVVISVMMLKEGWDVRNVKVIVPLRPCDSRTLTEQTLGRGLRKMHPPIIDEDGAAELEPEDLYVIEHESFGAIIEKINDLVERKEGDEISHAREYVAITQKEDALERDQRAVRLVRFEGAGEVTRDWHHGFDAGQVPALVPRMAWQSEVGETEIQTVLKRAMEREVAEGLDFTVPEVPSYRTFDQVIEGAYARPLLREMKLGFVYKNAVKSVVRDFLEERVFALPSGVPLSFSVDAGIERARVALANLARPDVIDAVRQAIRPALAKALASDRRVAAPQVSERRSSELPGFTARKKFVLEDPTKTNFDRAAMENTDEYRVAVLLEQAGDVTSWVYNHRSGVKYTILYDWMGFPVRYFPDFIVRFQMGAVTHNVIIEVKGRLDDRDKEKARQGQHHAEVLTASDEEPWHYLFLVENKALGRQDIGAWSEQADKSIARLLARHERLPLVPVVDGVTKPEAIVVPEVDRSEEYQSAVPVHDLAASAGAFGEEQSPTPIGWMRVSAARQLTSDMFIARVIGRSMEPASRTEAGVSSASSLARPHPPWPWTAAASSSSSARSLTPTRAAPTL